MKLLFRAIKKARQGEVLSLEEINWLDLCRKASWVGYRMSYVGNNTDNDVKDEDQNARCMKRIKLLTHYYDIALSEVSRSDQKVFRAMLLQESRNTSFYLPNSESLMSQEFKDAIVEASDERNEGGTLLCIVEGKEYKITFCDKSIGDEGMLAAGYTPTNLKSKGYKVGYMPSHMLQRAFVRL